MPNKNKNPFANVDPSLEADLVSNKHSEYTNENINDLSKQTITQIVHPKNAQIAITADEQKLEQSLEQLSTQSGNNIRYPQNQAPVHKPNHDVNNFFKNTHPDNEYQNNKSTKPIVEEDIENENDLDL